MNSLNWINCLNSLQCAGPPSHPVMRQTKSSIQFWKFSNACIYSACFICKFTRKKQSVFLDYCSHLSVCTGTSLPDGLLKNDTELQGWYVSHPDNNWSQDNFEVIDIKMEFTGDESVCHKPFSQGGAVDVVRHHSSPVPGVACEAMVMAVVPSEGEAEVGQFQCLSPSLGNSNM